MKNRTILFVLCLMVIAALPAYAQDAAASELLIRVNNLRASRGLTPYNYSAALAAAAQQQAQWMVETGNVSHSRPDGSTPATRAIANGYPTNWVSENIYGGLMATPDTAWNFWVNSSIHYAGMTNTSYSEIGIGSFTGEWGTAYVLVFGNPGSSLPGQGAPAANNSASGNPVADSAPAQPPAFVMGVDEQGNIMHQVQPGDTVGQIALIYGYTWEDIPRLMALNNMTDERDLEVGAIFLVPSYGGTFTPTPGGPTSTPSMTPTGLDVQLTQNAALVLTAAALATYTVTPLPFFAPAGTPAPDMGLLPTPFGTPIAQLPEATAEATANLTPSVTTLQIPTLPTTPEFIETSTQSTTQTQGPNWVAIAVILQVGVLVLAGTEFLMRSRTKK